MYEAYWKLKEKPFENTIDPRFMYFSPQHEEAYSRMQYAVTERKGAAMLTGVFGCGKTMVAQALIENLSSGKYEVSFVVNPQLSHVELLREIVYHLGAKDSPPKDKSDLLHLLDEMLHNNVDNGKDNVIIIDEAHLLDELAIFEELRLLLNFQYKGKFLLTLILVGQPPLREKVNNIKQLAQRIAIKYHLGSLTQEETKNYVLHRLSVAGRKDPIFDKDALAAIFDESGGIPRRINQICDLALLTGYGRKLDLIKKDVIAECVKDLEGTL